MLNWLYGESASKMAEKKADELHKTLNYSRLRKKTKEKK